MHKDRKAKKQFIVRKHVMAFSAAEAIRKEREYEVSDCWVDDEWVKNNETPKNVGFKNES